MGQSPSDEAHKGKVEAGDNGKPSSENPSRPVAVSRGSDEKAGADAQISNYAASPPSSLTDRVRKTLADGQDSLDSKRALPPAPQQPMETVPVAFKWGHGALDDQQVFITGSFNGWTGKIHMQRAEKNEPFVLTLEVAPGQHQYKYIIDGKWRLDPDAPTCTNNGNINNFIEVKRPVFEDPRSDLTALIDSDDELDENKQRVSYGQHVPSPEDYVREPLRLPPQLGPVLLNSPHASADPFVLPLPESHVVLNHLYVYGQPPGSAATDGVIVTGITQRFKLKTFASLMPKFVTTVYYSPKPGPGDGFGSGSTPGSAAPSRSGSASQLAGSGAGPMAVGS